MKILGVCLLLAILLKVVKARGGGGADNRPERYNEPTAIVGWKAYNTTQVTKATAKFLNWNHDGSWQFDDWNSWRERDGMLCRTSSDCTWLDKDLRCGKLTIDKNKRQSWFGGDSAGIAGRCMCSNTDTTYNVGWNEVELECQQTSLTGGSIVFIIIFGGIPGLVLFAALCFGLWALFEYYYYRY